MRRGERISSSTIPTVRTDGHPVANFGICSNGAQQVVDHIKKLQLVCRKADDKVLTFDDETRSMFGVAIAH